LRALVLGVFLFYIGYQWLDRLHRLRRLELLHVQREQKQANDDRQDNNGKAQITKEVIEQHQHIKDRVGKDVTKKVA
jgi:amino acid permease